jgi:hypothetical protein
VGFRVGRAHRSRPAFAGATRLDRFSRKFTHNPLKSPNSDEGFQGNPRESKSFRLGILSFFLGVLWTFLDWLGLACFRGAIPSPSPMGKGLPSGFDPGVAEGRMGRGPPPRRWAASTSL